MGTMMTSAERCIYCGTASDICRQAHAVPRSLGTFENQPALNNRVCRQCDSEIGICEEQLVKCGPEAILRIALGITGRSGSKSISPFTRGHAGQEALKLKARYPGTDYDILVEPVPGTHDARPLPQVVIVTNDGQCEHVLVPDIKITIEELDSRIKATGLKGQLTLWPIAATEEDQTAILNLLRGSNLCSGEIVDENIASLIATVEAQGTITVDPKYFRAVAKIAFHYFLANYVGFYGNEPCFEALRQFIRYGQGDTDDFVRQKHGNLVAELNQGYRPKYYGHFLIGAIEERFILVCVQLFIGCDINPQYYEVNLGNNPRQIVVPVERFGHFYSYFEPEVRLQYAGTIQKLFASSHIQVVHGLTLPYRPQG